MTRYQHTQRGTLVLAALGGAVLLNTALAMRLGWHPIALVVTALLVACTALFGTLTVEVTPESIQIRFGIGLIRKTFLVREIVEVQAVRNRWYYGWGIRWTPHGWLFNVSGLDAVQIRMRNGRQYRIGTDRPDELAAAVRNALENASA